MDHITALAIEWINAAPTPESRGIRRQLVSDFVAGNAFIHDDRRLKNSEAVSDEELYFNADFADATVGLCGR